MTTEKKKRVLKNLDFTGDNAHIALVSSAQGGPANGRDVALVLKSAEGYPKEFVEKMQQVRVTYELPEFLRTVFGLYYEDAEVLARMLGYVEPEDETSSSDNWYENYLNKKVESFEVLKSLNSAESITEALAAIKPEDYLKILQDQQMIEKALLDADKAKAQEGSTEAVAIAKESGKAKVVPSSKKKTEKAMTQKVEGTPEVEMIEKSALTAVEKALQDKQVELQKALDKLKEIEEVQKQAVIKSKSDKIAVLVKDEKQREIITKASLSLESEDDFGAFVAAIEAMMNSITTSDMFVEKGLNVQPQETNPVSALDRAIAAKFGTKQ